MAPNAKDPKNLKRAQDLEDRRVPRSNGLYGLAWLGLILSLIFAALSLWR